MPHKTISIRLGKRGLLLLPLALLVSCKTSPPTSNAATSPRPTRPAWVKEGIVMVGNWEPLTFIRRRGGQSLADVENWKAERTERVAQDLKQAGVNLVITNLHKGFGLKTEAEDIDATRRFTAFAHKHGLRVGGYIGASMAFETFFQEEPDARTWSQVDESGRPIYYTPTQTFRYMACRNNPGYQAFLQKVMRLGIQDIHLDLIHFDQMEGWAEPLSCHCPYCRLQFREFLRARYRPQQAAERFGFNRFDDVIPPAYDFFGRTNHATEVVNPLVQDWARFRCYSFARRYAEYDSFIYALNPEVALEGNPNLNSAHNAGFANGVDVSLLLAHGDVVWSEDPHHAQWTADGRLVSRIRAFKAARIMGKSIFVYTGGRYGAQNPESPPKLRLAEAMAYNDRNLGMVGDVSPNGVTLTPEARRYIDFFHARRQDLSGTVSISDIAVLHSFASIEFNPSEANVSTILAEQTLIQNRIPFDIIYDRHLADLRKYKVLLLANQDALGDDQIALIRRFVAAGGGLVATENTGLYTDWRLKRSAPALADLYGTGRVVYIPAIEPAVPPPPAELVYDFVDEYWRLPKNAAEIVRAVEQAAGAPLSVRVSAPSSVTIELARQTATGNLLLHLVNYNFTKPVQNIEAAVRIPPGYRLQEIILTTPDSGIVQSLPVQLRGDSVVFKIPKLEVYDLVLLRLAPA